MANSRGGDDPESTPICRCRVLYLGSAVPHVTKDGLQGIQEPLRELYPEQGALGARGIDSWLSVWSNGLLLENVDENHKKVTRFFPIDSLHYCAAVRYVLVPERAGAALGGAGGGGTLLSSGGGSGGGPSPRFLPLDSPFARTPNPSHPPLFAAILRRTTGIKVLECHAFICKREMAANALVRCCFHAYADSSYARHMDGSGGGSNYGTLRSTQGGDSAPGGGGGGGGPGSSDSWRRSTLSLNHHSSAGAGGTLTSNASAASALSGATDDVSIYNGDENHKVWVGSGTLEREEVYGGGGGGGSSTVRSSRSQRPRQVVAPVSAPPPPPTPKEEKAAKKAAASAKERHRRKKLLGGSVDNLMMLNGMSGGGSLLRPHSSMSGAHHHQHHQQQHHQQQQQQQQHRYANGGGSLLRHANGYHQHQHQHAHAHPHHYAPAGPPPPGPPLVLATLPSRPRQAKARAGAGKLVLQPLPVPVPLLAPVPGPHPPGTGRRRHAPPPGPLVVPVEEPVYMPSARPMSPVASFQPAHFPHEAYLMQQYATVEHPGRHAKKKAAKHKGAAPPPAVMPVPVPVPVQPPPPHVLVNGGGASPDEDEIAVLAEDSTSPFNTGIYRKKGHLNERAFSYSIRQEHRSRSYGSLANLKFSGPDLKKEREIAQMMQDLELSSGDELERSDVPPPHQRGSLRAANVRR